MQVLSFLIITYMAVMSQSEARVGLGDWNQFKTQYHKTYENATVEAMRRSIFFQNKHRIDKFNEERSQELGFTLGLNHLSDWTTQELKRLNGFKVPEGQQHLLQNTPEAQRFLESILNDKSIEVPDEIDWRKVPGRVTGVKDQGNCGSCWAFSTTGVLEGQEAVRNKTLASTGPIGLSEQNLVDCDRKSDNGCKGGFMQDALEFIHSQGGIDDDTSYPYEAQDGTCRFKKDKVVISDSGAAILPTGDEQKLKEVVAKFGPVAVAVDATLTFMSYGGGILHDDECSNKLDDLNHGVLVVGYGSDNKDGDYWIVKNSWGDYFGEDGYIRMARNKNNNCGVATAATIPTF